jgi:hypothetical protein
VKAAQFFKMRTLFPERLMFKKLIFECKCVRSIKNNISFWGTQPQGLKVPKRTVINVIEFSVRIIRRSRNDQHYALICTTPLYCILAPTCFSSSLPSSGSFLDPSKLFEVQIEWVVYAVSWKAQQTEPQHSGTQAT